jgi:hypothetical protein
MLIQWITIRHHSSEVRIQIFSDRRIGIFTDYQGRAGMLDKNMTQTGFNPAGSDRSLNVTCNFVSSASAGSNLQSVLVKQD